MAPHSERVRLDAFVRQVRRLMRLPSHGARVRRIRRRREDWRDLRLADELLAASILHGAARPGLGKQLVDLAWQVVWQISMHEGWSLERLADYHALVQAYRGNVRRLARHFRRAELHFRHAHHLLSRGKCEPGICARVLSLEGSFLLDTLRLNRAIEVLNAAHEWATEAGDGLLEGKILLQQETIAWAEGNYEHAVHILRQATIILRPLADPSLALRAIHNLADDLCRLGRYPEARKVFLEARNLYASCADPKQHLLRSWLEGRIAQGLGQIHDARRHFLSVRAGFLGRHNVFDALLVSLDLAGLYLQFGHADALRDLAAEIEALLGHSQVERVLHGEGRATLRRFLQAASQQRATPDLLAASLVACGSRAGTVRR